MASHSMGPYPAMPPEWNSPSPIYTRNQMVACLRAGVIALALLGILACLVLF